MVEISLLHASGLLAFPVFLSVRFAVRLKNSRLRCARRPSLPINNSFVITRLDDFGETFCDNLCAYRAPSVIFKIRSRKRLRECANQKEVECRGVI
jgi:hypothetical protein